MPAEDVLPADVLRGERDELTPEEGRAYLEAQIQEDLGMSLEEFRARARAGTLPDRGVVRQLTMLAGVSEYYHC
jgi:hypothetical protein